MSCFFKSNWFWVCTLLIYFVSSFIHKVEVSFKHNHVELLLIWNVSKHANCSLKSSIFFCWQVQFIENISLLQCWQGCCAVAMRLLYGCYAFACFVLHVFRTFFLFSPILCKINFFFKIISSKKKISGTCNL